MRVRITKPELSKALRFIQWLLGAGAILLLGYDGVLLAETWLFQRGETLRLEQRLRYNRPPGAAPRIPITPVAAGGLIGRIEIPRLGLAVIVVEGADKRDLRRAAGHIPGTALPGQPGNVGISAHRDTFFRPLRNIRRDDIIKFTTLQGEYRYAVVSTKIVGSQAVEVLAAGADEIITLITCYPFYYVGPAPDRFIVRAARVI